jgi:Na+/proline symporter
MLGFILLVSLSMSGNWSLVQRFYAARSEKDARRVGWTAGILFLLLPPVWIVAGMAARVWLPGNWAQNNDPQYVYAEISRLLLPPGLLGLIVAALFAATMSVLSAGYNVIASVLTVDVYRRHIRPRASQRHLLVVGKILTVAVGLTAMAVAGLVLHFRWTIFDTMVTAFGFFLPPTVLPVLAGLVWPRITSRGALAGFLAGLASGTAFLGVRVYLPASYNYPLQTVSIWVSSAVVVLAMFLASRKDTPERARIAEFYRSLAQPAVPSPAAKLPEPFLISGVVLLLLGLVLGGIGGFARGPGRLALWVGLLLTALGGALLWRHGRRAHEPRNATESP